MMCLSASPVGIFSRWRATKSLLFLYDDDDDDGVRYVCVHCMMYAMLLCSSQFSHDECHGIYDILHSEHEPASTICVYDERYIKSILAFRSRRTANNGNAYATCVCLNKNTHNEWLAVCAMCVCCCVYWKTNCFNMFIDAENLCHWALKFAICARRRVPGDNKMTSDFDSVITYISDNIVREWCGLAAGADLPYVMSHTHKCDEQDMSLQHAVI